MKGLPTLIRLHQWQLDQKRKELTSLERLKADFVAQLDRLQQDLLSEQQAAAGNEIGMFAYASYAIGVTARRRTLNESIEEVEEQIISKRAEITAAFHEVKRYEIAQREVERRREAELARLEQINLDEVAMNIYRLRTADAQ